MPPNRAPQFLHRRLANAVRSQRGELGISQEELAKRCGLHRTYIGAIERGERNVSLATLELLAVGLGVDPAETLLDENSRLVVGRSGGD